ncbi:MAG: hypothetical protein OXI40_12265 [Chloroflexota bacterium]|nr:hypothetical protein [Chloroflexota bacterium]
MSEESRSREILEKIYQEAVTAYETDGSDLGFSEVEENFLSIVIEYQEKRKAVVAVLFTLLLKKIISPDQDIRLHRAEFDGGFSGRRLDTKVVTPFLRSKQFPNMSESGWLTRSFEQSHSYDFNYPGNISPKKLKAAFLSIVDNAQRAATDKSKSFLRRLFIGLIEFRDRNKNLRLARPVNLSIAQLVERLIQHHNVKNPGAARLPVLAMHAILTVLARETERYRNCQLLPLEAHTTADSRSQLAGDINILDGTGTFFEGYEIKHNVPITTELIQTSFQKIRTSPVKVFYILTTYFHEDYEQFKPAIEHIARSHGCQLIVNGVDRTLLYYLRLIGDTRSFIDVYVSHLENDDAITFELKDNWNKIAVNS